MCKAHSGGNFVNSAQKSYGRFTNRQYRIEDVVFFCCCVPQANHRIQPYFNYMASACVFCICLSGKFDLCPFLMSLTGAPPTVSASFEIIIFHPSHDGGMMRERRSGE